jgi:hypothetical protein
MDDSAIHPVCLLLMSMISTQPGLRDTSRNTLPLEKEESTGASSDGPERIVPVDVDTFTNSPWLCCPEAGAEAAFCVVGACTPDASPGSSRLS